MNLTLMSRVVAADMAYIVLQRVDALHVRYFFLASEVSHRVVTTGIIDGSIDKDLAAYTIMLSSIQLLTSKDFKLSLSLVDGKMIFTDSEERFKLQPLCVESMDSRALDALQNFMEFYTVLQSNNNSIERLEKVQKEIVGRTESIASLKTLSLNGNSDDIVMPTQQEVEFLDELKAEEKDIQHTMEVNGLTRIDLRNCKPAAYAAARFNSVLEVYDNVAVVRIGNGSNSSFLFVKHIPGTYCIHGRLLNKLLASANKDHGVFYDYNRQLVYHVQSQDKKKKGQLTETEKSETFVFVTKYLPKGEIDSSILTRGVVEEKYTLDLKNVLTLATLAASNFPNLTIDLGEGTARLTNEQAEEIIIPLTISDAKSIQLNRFLKGKDNGADLSMAVISLPSQIRDLLSLFKGEVTLYVKHSKIILNSGDCWLVFGRS